MKKESRSGGKMKNFFAYLMFLLLITSVSCSRLPENSLVTKDVRKTYPCPLITIDDNISVWSSAATLYGVQPRFLDGKPWPFTGILQVDGKNYRFIGSGEGFDEAIAGLSGDELWEGKYIFTKPSKGWQQPEFDDSGWDSGAAPFGSMGYHSPYYMQINTIWPSPFIWVRRRVNINEKELAGKKLYIRYSHDDVFELYVNGTLIVETGFVWGEDKWVEIPAEVIAALRTGEVVIAAHGQNLFGNSLLDFGIYASALPKGERSGHYTFSQPSEGWEKEDFDDTVWDTGKLPFGTLGGYSINTVWDTPDIWIRRTIEIAPDALEKTLLLNYSHDDILDVYVNGTQVVKTGFEWGLDKIIEIPDSVKKTIQNGKVLIAAHCMNKAGGAFVDFDIRADEVASQLSVDVQATRTCYQFACGPVKLTLTFTAPLLLNDLELLSRPINYISYDIHSLDEKPHDVTLYCDATPAWISDGGVLSRTIEISQQNNLWFVKMARNEPHLFEQNHKNWGGFYLSADTAHTSVEKYGASYIRMTKSLGKTTTASGTIMVGYDDMYAVQYFGENIRPYWNRNGDKTMEQLFAVAYRDYPDVSKKCNAFDKQFEKEQGSFTYRQMVAAYKIIADESGDLLFVSRKGVAEIVRSAPFFSHNSRFLKAQLTPLLKYSASDNWEKEYAPSTLGDYPLLNGQISSTQTSVESTSRMLFLLSMITALDGNDDYAQVHWPLIQQWHCFLQQSKQNPDFAETAGMGITAYNYIREMAEN